MRIVFLKIKKHFIYYKYIISKSHHLLNIRSHKIYLHFCNLATFILLIVFYFYIDLLAFLQFISLLLINLNLSL